MFTYDDALFHPSGCPSSCRSRQRRWSCQTAGPPHYTFSLTPLTELGHPRCLRLPFSGDLWRLTRISCCPDSRRLSFFFVRWVLIRVPLSHWADSSSRHLPDPWLSFRLGGLQISAPAISCMPGFQLAFRPCFSFFVTGVTELLLGWAF